MRKFILQPDRKMTVLEALVNEGISIKADCGGHGKCGKCLVIVDGETCLACKTSIERKTEVEIPKESRLDGVYIENIESEISAKSSPDLNVSKTFFMCVDIGTTTVAAILSDDKGRIHASSGCMNSQRVFGADIVSRIEAAGKGNLQELKISIRKDIKKLKAQLAESVCVSEDKITEVYISANTVMGHLFMGYSLKGFEKAPYTAETLDIVEDGEFELLAGLSPFVGADILSGIAACRIDRSDKIVALIDLGTNGEMALGCRDGILIASTAAGPVFEGGGISCGMPAGPGAVADIEISGMRVFTRTIDSKEPVGICGTGIVSAVSELRKNGIIDKNGIFGEEFIDEGFPITSDIYITKDDIRSFQMAKAAVAAGFSTLCSELSVRYDDIDILYIAGGFGKHLDINKAAEAGLIPEELKDRCVLVGNTSLKGALMRGLGSLDNQRIQDIKGMCKEIVLAENEYFQQKYIDNMQL